MKRILIYFGIFIYIFLSCSERTTLNLALAAAGKNRAELEKVLLNYSSPKDSLKYMAACFLIENMLYHHYYENEELDKYKNTLKMISTLSDTIEMKTIRNNFLRDTMDVINRRYFGSLRKKDGPVSDLKTMKSEYFIANIDHAFMVWEKQPWGKYIPFDLFCREILPYRIGDEPLEDWRKEYYDYFQPVLDSLLIDNNPVTACQIIYDTISKMDWHFIQDLPVPNLGGKMLLKYRLGNCSEYSDFALYTMRALGICGGIDLIVQNPDYNFAYHYWNYMRDTTGQIKEFELYEMRPDGLRKGIRLKGVVYRHHFCIQKEALCLSHPNRKIPPTLVTPFLSNVSADYFKEYDITLSVKATDELHYLYVFDNKGWKPVTWSKIGGKESTYHSLEPEIVFFPGCYRKGKLEPTHDPFVLLKEKTVHFFTPDTINKIDLILKRKHRIRGHLMERYEKKTYKGKFEGSNNPDFKRAYTLFIVSDIDQPVYYEKKLFDFGKFRYIRYLSNDTLCCNMAEVEIFSSDSKLVKGEIIASECMFGEGTSYSKETIFDRNPLTFFHAKDTSGGWVGMDFGKPQNINRIRYLFRNDDNNIRESDLYELFYYTKDGYKISLGQQVGNREQLLTFRNCPANALYLLHNHTRGNEQRIFSYENGKQIWW